MSLWRITGRDVLDLETVATADLDAYRREVAAHADRLARRQRGGGNRKWRGGYSATRARQIKTLQAEYDRVVRALLARGWR